MLKVNRTWDYKFTHGNERRRARSKGYGLIVLRPGTSKAEKALVEFDDEMNIIPKRYPLRFYDTCLMNDCKPSEAHLYYVSRHNPSVYTAKKEKNSLEIFTNKLLSLVDKSNDEVTASFDRNFKAEEALSLEKTLLSNKEVEDVLIKGQTVTVKKIEK